MRNIRIGLFALSSFWALGFGCSKSSGPELPGRTVMGRIVGSDGKPVSGVRILLGKTSVKSDDTGRYSLETDSKQGVLRFEKSGFLTGLERVQVEKNFSVGLDVVLLKRGPKVTIDADEGGEAQGPRGSFVRIPKSALVDPDGERVKGAVDVYLTPIDPKQSAELRAAPGDFVTDDDGQQFQLESFGMLDVTIEKGDAKLNVLEGESLEIKVPLPSGVDDPEAEMPLYSFDEERGIWVQEGTATLAEDGQGYVGSIPHLSAWNIDKPYEATCVSGRVVDKDGEPIAGARVRGMGTSYTGESVTTTDKDGRFALAVRRDSEVQVSAEHPLGGGRAKDITSGDAETEVPPSVGDEGCQDGGTWTIEEGTYVDPGGEVSFCSELTEGDFAGGCLLEFAEQMGGCKAKLTGACSATTGETGVVMEYEDGSRFESGIDGIAVFDGTGDLCYRMVPGADGETVTYEFGDGSDYELNFGQDGTEFTMTCPDGETYSLTTEESAAISACNPSTSGGGDGTGGSSGSMACTFNDPSGSGGGGSSDGTGGTDSGDGTGGTDSGDGTGGTDSGDGTGGSNSGTPDGTYCEDDPDCTGADQVCCPVATDFLICYPKDACAIITG